MLTQCTTSQGSHYLGTLLPLMRTPQMPVVDWTDAPAYLNGLVRFVERRNLVSARVPSHFKLSLQRRLALYSTWLWLAWIVFEDLNRASQYILCVRVMTTNQVMICREIKTHMCCMGEKKFWVLYLVLFRITIKFYKCEWQICIHMYIYSVSSSGWPIINAVLWNITVTSLYRVADKSLSPPTSRCIFLWLEYFVWC